MLFPLSTKDCPVRKEPRTLRDREMIAVRRYLQCAEGGGFSSEGGKCPAEMLWQQ